MTIFLYSEDMNSAATAIARTTVSAPTEWLTHYNYLYGKVCHFGEGKAFLDTEALADIPEVDEVFAYEPYSIDEGKQVFPSGCPFDFVVANYVLNTLTPAEREEAFVKAFLAGCYSIFTVRIDRVQGDPIFDGVVTQRGTFQTQLKAEEWVVWFYDTLRTRLAGNYHVKILHKTRSYLMVEVY
jgi:hypothetical protein